MSVMPALVALVALGALLGWISAAEGFKSQVVRLFDVILFGPFFVALGVLLAYRMQLPRPLALATAAACVLLGASTATYNLRNFLAEQQKPDGRPAGHRHDLGFAEPVAKLST
jgi:hypothetical protein